MLLCQLLLLSIQQQQQETAEAETVQGRAAGVEGAEDVEGFFSCRKNKVVGRACTAAVEAVVEGVEVLAAARCSPSTFILLEVSVWGVSPPTEGVC